MSMAQENGKDFVDLRKSGRIIMARLVGMAVRGVGGSAGLRPGPIVNWQSTVFRREVSCNRRAAKYSAAGGSCRHDEESGIEQMGR